ncbi:hypothetical protein OUZ56_020375 [Daphnia magna]|uniref:Uncharacterized protein n=1 Tax=Daphnia magna TaxID=35525 RepID=A0ABQ9ZEB3_9CRUS|nr:hypothetical protein OUZ56_020375 [Daphnia magna]
MHFLTLTVQVGNAANGASGWFLDASWIVSEKKPRPDRHLKLKHTWVALIRAGCCIMADLLFCPKSRHKEALNQDVSFERTSSVSGGMSLFACSHHPDAITYSRFREIHWTLSMSLNSQWQTL